MKFFTNIKESNDQLTFDLISNNKVNKSYANAMRRLIIAKTPIIAADIKNIVYLKNSSVLNSDILSKRIALFPWYYSDMKKHDLSNLELRLSVENKVEEIKDIFCNDFHLFDGEKELSINTYSVYPKNLFLKLKPYQSIELIAKFKESIQFNDGAVFIPTAVSIFTYKQDAAALTDALKQIPKDMQTDFTIENRERLFLRDAEGEPTIFQFTIETVGQHTNKTLVKQCFNTIIEELDTLVKGLAEKNADVIDIVIPKISMNAYDFVIAGEDDTLGYLLQTYLMKNAAISFAGYEIVHPLKKTLIVRMSLKENNNLENNKKIFIDTITEIKKLTMELIKDWSVKK